MGSLKHSRLSGNWKSAPKLIQLGIPFIESKNCYFEIKFAKDMLQFLKWYHISTKFRVDFLKIKLETSKVNDDI